MSVPSQKPFLARRRLRIALRRAGWVMLGAGAVWALVASALTKAMTVTPLLVGLAGVLAARGAARLLRRYSHSLERGGQSQSAAMGSGGSRVRRRRTAGAAVSSAPIEPAVPSVQEPRSAEPFASEPFASEAPAEPFAGEARPAEPFPRAQRPVEPFARAPRTAKVSLPPRRVGTARRRRPLRDFALGLGVLAITGLVALWLCFDDQPLVARSADLQMETYEKADKFMEAHDPRNGGPGLRTFVASQDEVNVVLNYAARRFRGSSVHVELKPGIAHAQVSVPTPWCPFGDWLNVDAVMRDTSRVPAVEKLKVGSLPVPAFIAEFVFDRVIEHYGASERARVAQDMLQSLALEDSQVRIVYMWREDLVGRARAALVSPEEQTRFRAYSDRLATLIGSGASKPSVALSELLAPMFALAKQRSAGGNAAEENRAAIITLALYAFGKDLSVIIPAAANWRNALPVEVTVHGLDDKAQHFLVSAALAIEGGSPLANAIGAYREMADSRLTGTGKGFSFQDLVADRAGTRFGILASRSPQVLQQSVSVGIKDLDFMPRFDDLPDEIPEARFKSEYGGIGSPAYNKLVAEIDSRIVRTPLLQ